MMDYCYGVMIFLFGTVIGSFLNVCIDRFSLKRTIIQQTCTVCGTRLSAIDMFPIMSDALFQRKCKERISLFYPLVEAMTGVLFLLLYLKLGLVWVLPIYAALFCLLIVASYIDLRHMIIPNGIIAAGFVVGAVQLVASVFTDVFAPWYSYIIGFFVGGLTFFLIALVGNLVLKKEVMGGGDIKLMTFCGLIIGWKLLIPAILIGFIAGAVITVALLAIGRIKHGDAVPFGPFLALGVIASVFFGYELINWYMGLF